MEYENKYLEELTVAYQEILERTLPKPDRREESKSE